jgi:hypothetical protein
MDFTILETEVVVFFSAVLPFNRKARPLYPWGVYEYYDPLVRSLLFYVKAACGAKL